MDAQGLLFDDSIGRQPVGGAVFSQDKRYRYRLTRAWASDKRVAVFVGLNPSVADSHTDDHTITREMYYARREGCGSLVKVNLYAMVATIPVELVKAIAAGDAMGPRNDDFVREAVHTPGALVVAAWGAHAAAAKRVRALDDAGIFAGVELWCLGKSFDGAPRHPSRLGSAVPLERWR